MTNLARPGWSLAATAATCTTDFIRRRSVLRLTRFDGPDVLNWKILAQRPTSHYLKGEWNRLKVRVEESRVLCYVNGQVVMTQPLDQPPTGRVGLAKFRDTRAEFKTSNWPRRSSSRSSRLRWPNGSKHCWAKGLRQKRCRRELVEELTPESPDQRRGADRKGPADWSNRQSSCVGWRGPCGSRRSRPNCRGCSPSQTNESICGTRRCGWPGSTMTRSTSRRIADS